MTIQKARAGGEMCSCSMILSGEKWAGVEVARAYSAPKVSTGRPVPGQTAPHWARDPLITRRPSCTFWDTNHNLDKARGFAYNNNCLVSYYCSTLHEVARFLDAEREAICSRNDSGACCDTRWFTEPLACVWRPMRAAGRFARCARASLILVSVSHPAFPLGTPGMHWRSACLPVLM